jgi:hypothetical protein
MGLFSVKAHSPEQIEKQVRLHTQHGDVGVDYGGFIYVTSSETDIHSAYIEGADNNIFMLNKNIVGSDKIATAYSIGHICLTHSYKDVEQLLGVDVPLKVKNDFQFESRYYPASIYTGQENIGNVSEQVARKVAARAIFDVVNGEPYVYREETISYFDKHQEIRGDLDNLLEELIKQIEKD